MAARSGRMMNDRTSNPPNQGTVAATPSTEFDPASISTFRYVDWSFDDQSNTATFRYALDDVEFFVETYTFPAPAGSLVASQRAAFLRALSHLFLAAGLSYYKIAAPSTVRIEVGVWTLDEIEFHRRVLAKGLGEFCFMNNLAPELWPFYEYQSSATKPVLEGLGLRNAPLVPVGGGKDSCVSIEALRSAALIGDTGDTNDRGQAGVANGRFAPTLITVNRYPVIQEVINDAELADLAVVRSLDLEQLRSLNDRGALNGHVPATAIVSLAVAACAILHGHDAVVMSNERSASEGNVEYRGVEINHQWSKSEEAEEMIAALLGSITPELRYFSLLRPLSELGIARRFAQTCDRYLNSFSSCNAAFRLDPTRRVSRWCGQCPKCQFVYLALATALPRSTVESIWGADLFTTSSTEGFAALLGLTDWKPFECVGESGECRVALRLVLEQPQWQDHPVLAQLRSQVLAAGKWPTDDDVQALFALADARIPSDYMDVLDGFSERLSQP